jgi:hypothetical protein
MKNIFKFLIVASLWGSESRAADLYGPPMAQWGMKPFQVQAIYGRKFKYVGSYPKPDLPKVIYQQKYIGKWLQVEPAHISPMYYLGRFFSLSIYYPPVNKMGTSEIWEKLVAELTRIYGKPHKITRPRKLTSANATTAQYPVDEGEAGRFKVLDSQIQTGIWVPNAEWRFNNRSFINALIHASDPPDEKGMRFLLPLVVYNKHDILH